MEVCPLVRTLGKLAHVVTGSKDHGIELAKKPVGKIITQKAAPGKRQAGKRPRYGGIAPGDGNRVALFGKMKRARRPHQPSPADDENPLLAFIERYGPAAGEEGPIMFATEVFGLWEPIGETDSFL